MQQTRCKLDGGLNNELLLIPTEAASHDNPGRGSKILTRAGLGTAMGGLMRPLWIPAAASWEIEADGNLVRVMLLGEKLIAFRDTSEHVGIIDHRCPHSYASLFFGRNE